MYGKDEMRFMIDDKCAMLGWVVLGRRAMMLTQPFEFGKYACAWSCVVAGAELAGQH